jgi:hypothetical protein
MADTLTTNLTNLMYEMRERAVRVFPTRAVFLSELEGVNKDAEPVYNGRGRVRKDTPEGRKIFSGKWARDPAASSTRSRAPAPIAEAGTVNTPHVVNTNEAHIPITRDRASDLDLARRRVRLPRTTSPTWPNAVADGDERSRGRHAARRERDAAGKRRRAPRGRHRRPHVGVDHGRGGSRTSTSSTPAASSTC